MFTATAPLTSIVTYLYVILLVTNITFVIGIFLLISAGSFIYVATMHILPETVNDKTSIKDLFLLIGTSLLPYCLTLLE